MVRLSEIEGLKRTSTEIEQPKVQITEPADFADAAGSAVKQVFQVQAIVRNLFSKNFEVFRIPHDFANCNKVPLNEWKVE